MTAIQQCCGLLGVLAAGFLVWGIAQTIRQLRAGRLPRRPTAGRGAGPERLDDLDVEVPEGPALTRQG